MEAIFYGMRISHPSRTAELMLAHKGIEAERVEIPPTTQRLLMRRHGFRGGTVPGLRLDGRRVQGTRAIARALEEAQPEPPLFPGDPELRAKVEEAERWGDEIYQPVPRRIFRWLLASDSGARAVIAKSVGLPLPAITQALMWPVGQLYLRDEGGGEEAARRDLAEIPSHLAKVDALLDEGVIGGESPNAADFQIAATTRVLMNFSQLRPLAEGRPAGTHALKIAANFGREVPVQIPKHLLPASAS